MKYFSMFSGIAGFEKGIMQAYANKRVDRSARSSDSVPRRQEEVNRAGVGDSQIERSLHESYESEPVCVGFSEIDKYAIQVYQSHFPHHHNYGDATKLDTALLPDFDLLVGGFPCQAFSVAGKRRGFDEARGTLFFEIARVLRDKKPRYFLLENVKGLLSHAGGETFQSIVGVLTDLGYFVEWEVLNSKNFGVPQNRERVFLIGHLGGLPRSKIFPLFGDDAENLEPPPPVTSNCINPESQVSQ